MSPGVLVRIFRRRATRRFGAGVARELARARFDVTAGGQTWQQVTALRDRAEKENTRLEVIKKAELTPFGIEVATVNPMPDAAPLLALQHDPKPMIEAIVEMVRDRKSQYRTMLPEDAVIEARASQALGWTQKA